VESRVTASGRDWQSFTLDELESFWQEAKAIEKAMSNER
jgi:tetrapyrrole methylase family protein/MazG family protein